MDDKKKSDNIIDNLLKRLIDIECEDVKPTKNPLHVQTVASATEQYLTPFITLGYDVNGEAVAISNAKNQKDIDSIMISLERYLSHLKTGSVCEDIGDMLDDEYDDLA